ncbi:hypothetical protein SL053_002486 [Flavobacterium psychrophilum]|nr:hypothetical protein [Flavobacterium psychrophilum]
MLKPSEFSRTTQKIENNLIKLTPEIEKKLENMSTDLLTKTVIDYEKYKYDITVRNKAEEILNKRGVLLEKKVITETQLVKNSNVFIFYFLILLFIAGYIYFQYHPSYLLSTLSFILFGVIWLFRYYYINNKN